MVLESRGTAERVRKIPGGPQQTHLSSGPLRAPVSLPLSLLCASPAPSAAMASASNDSDDARNEKDLPKRKGLTEKGIRAAATRAENNEKRRREDEQLIRETEGELTSGTQWLLSDALAGGRQAKNNAKINAGTHKELSWMLVAL